MPSGTVNSLTTQDDYARVLGIRTSIIQDVPEPVERVPRIPSDAGSDGSDDTVVAKITLILRAFAGTSKNLGLTELSKRSGVSKASTFRLAEQLVGRGLIVKTGRGYQLGWWIHELGQSVPGPALLRAAARPTLVDLRTATNALVVHLAVLHGDDVVYLERIGGRREVALLSVIGTSVPAEQTVSGRVLLAYRRATGESSPIPVERGAEYAAIRKQRSSSEREMVVPGAKTFAVPIEYAGGSKVIAAISATVQASRTDEQLILGSLWAAAVDIARTVSTTAVR